MKIGMVSRFPPVKCGVGIYADELVKHLDCEVVKIGSKESDADYKINLSSWLLKERISEIVELEKLDIVHFQYIAASGFYGGFKTLNLNFLRALNQKVPVIVTLHEFQQDRTGLKNCLLYFLQGEIVKRANTVICFSPKQTEFLKKEYNAENVVCIFMGVEDHRKKIIKK